MAGQLRIAFSGALYHVTSRGDRRELIFEDDHDRLALQEVPSQKEAAAKEDQGVFHLMLL